jgi:hypothetical protein
MAVARLGASRSFRLTTVKCQFAVVSTAECGGCMINESGIKQTRRLHEHYELERPGLSARVLHASYMIIKPFLRLVMAAKTTH